MTAPIQRTIKILSLLDHVYLIFKKQGGGRVLGGFIWLRVCPTGGVFDESNETLGYIICKEF